MVETWLCTGVHGYVQVHMVMYRCTWLKHVQVRNHLVLYVSSQVLNTSTWLVFTLSADNLFQSSLVAGVRMSTSLYTLYKELTYC